MALQFHTTIFGQLVRLLSGSKLFRYPDEIDPSIWNKSVQRDASPPSTSPGEQAESSKESDTPDVALQNHAVEDGRDTLLVSWYGPDDPEVCTPDDSTDFKSLTQITESPELACRVKGRDRFPNVYPQLCRLHCQFHLCSW